MAIYVKNGDTIQPVQLCVTSYKNLFNINKIIPVPNKLFVNENGTLTIFGEYITGGAIMKNICPGLKVGDTVTLSMKNSTLSNPQVYFPDAKVFLNNKKSITITENILKSRITFYGKKGSVSTIISDIQIEKGTIATPYTPYGYQSLLLNSVSSKNLFDINAITGGTNYIGTANYDSYVVVQDNSVILKMAEYNANLVLKGNQVYLDKGTYVWSCTVTSFRDTSNSFSLKLYDITTGTSVYKSPYTKIEAKSTISVRYIVEINEPNTYNFALVPMNGTKGTDIMEFSDIKFMKLLDV